MTSFLKNTLGISVRSGHAVWWLGLLISAGCSKKEPDCTETIEEFCAERAWCVMEEEPECGIGFLPERQISKGCGFYKEVWAGDVRDSGVRVWAEQGDGFSLIYSKTTPGWDGSPDAECKTYVRGEMPDCDDWVLQCDSTDYSYGGNSGSAGESGQ